MTLLPRAVRCEAKITHTRRCRCVIRRDRGSVRDSLGYVLAVLCENHQKVLLREGVPIRARSVMLNDGRFLHYSRDRGVEASA